METFEFPAKTIAEPGLTHLEETEVDSGHGFDETLIGGGELELPELAGCDAASGGAGKTDLPEEVS